MAKEKIHYNDIADYILGSRATQDFKELGSREEFLQKLAESQQKQEAKHQKKAAAKEAEESCC